jgi:hypothetical protein
VIRFPVYLDKREAFDLAKACKLVATYDEMESFRNWLQDELQRLDIENRYEPDEVTLRQRQGSCMALANILKYVGMADEKMKDFS